MSDSDKAIDPAELKAGGWEGIWKNGLQPGQKFDAARMSPITALKLASGEVSVEGKTCLVPGCGRGYDVISFAKAGAASSIGLEIAPTAVVRANEYKDSQLDAATADKARIEQADFFEYAPPDGGIQFGYDYTFMCALQPEQRQAWADTWAKLISPGGQLATLIFPVDPERTGGPPFAVDPDLYRSLLTPVGFKEVQIEKVPDELSHEGRSGKEFFGLWQRQ